LIEERLSLSRSPSLDASFSDRSLEDEPTPLFKNILLIGGFEMFYFRAPDLIIAW
jgi:hypothetical protein